MPHEVFPSPHDYAQYGLQQDFQRFDKGDPVLLPLMKLFDNWDHVGAKTWVANPARSTPTTPGSLPAMSHTRGSLSRRPSMSRMDTVRQHQPPLEDQNRKLKELRLAELARQLELTELQHGHPHHPQYNPSVLPPPPLMSRPMTPISKLSVENPGPPLSNEDLIWEQKLREAEELNARIESLRQSGMPPDQLPSPVLLPSRPLSRATTRTDKPFPNCVPPRDYQNPPLPSFTSVSEAGLRRQLSKRSLHSVSSHAPISPNIPPPPLLPLSQPNQNQDRTASAGQAGYYQALKEAEELICKLRQSHDELLEKVNYLENQLDLKEADNQDLNTRNNRLETYLADEQKMKEDIRKENERAMAQLRSLSRSQPPHPHHPTNRSEPHHQHPLNPQTEPLPGSLQERIYRSQSGSVPPDHHHPPNISRARAELLKREENFQRQYSFRAQSATPDLARPGSTLGHDKPGHLSPRPMNTGTSQAHNYHPNQNKLYEPPHQSGGPYQSTQIPPPPQSSHPSDLEGGLQAQPGIHPTNDPHRHYEDHLGHPGFEPNTYHPGSAYMNHHQAQFPPFQHPPEFSNQNLHLHHQLSSKPSIDHSLHHPSGQTGFNPNHHLHHGQLPNSTYAPY
ncbi:hypothetical protein MJO28_007568 [Puccinia striiformis f. sp. tritici]|uniref:Uncharacterized protein n=1 Tax=Puccinia striiformis f. sp. tritici TaxID=168172 RepID=A0ACC0EGH6_9BASI|nr:hypothetical protein MJO28_007568 [Puccinia striiformis f. sp. tritici]